MKPALFFNYAALALFAGALLHVVGLLMGPDAIEFLGAPKEFVEGARNGDWAWTAFVTLGIAALLAGLGFLSLRARPPRTLGKFSRFILIAFAAIFTVRGILAAFFLPAIFKGEIGPDPLNFWFHFAASLFVLSIGLALTKGLVKTAGPAVGNVHEK